MIHTTGIGSLPIADFDDAIDYVLQNYTLPFYPEVGDSRSPLPNMMSHLLDDCSLTALEQGDWPTFHASLAANSKVFSYVGQLAKWQFATRKRLRKVQIIGPKTLSSIWQRAFPKADSSHIEFAAIAFLANKYQRLQQELSDSPTLICFDEPALHQAGLPQAGRLLATLKRQITAHPLNLLGVHTCSSLPLDILVNAYPNFGLAVDCTQSAIPLDDIKRLKSETHRPWLILGIAGTAQENLNTQEIEILAGLVKPCSTVNDSKIIAVSGGCGTSNRSLAFEQEMAATLLAATQ